MEYTHSTLRRRSTPQRQATSQFEGPIKQKSVKQKSVKQKSGDGATILRFRKSNLNAAKAKDRSPVPRESDPTLGESDPTLGESDLRIDPVHKLHNAQAGA